MLTKLLRWVVGLLLVAAAVRLLLLGALLVGIHGAVADLQVAFKAPLITTAAGMLFLLFVPSALWERWGRTLLIVLMVMAVARGVARRVTQPTCYRLTPSLEVQKVGTLGQACPAGWRMATPEILKYFSGVKTEGFQEVKQPVKFYLEGKDVVPILFAEPGLCKYFNQPGINPYTGNELQPAPKVFRDCEAEKAKAKQLAAEDRAATASAEAQRRVAAARRDITALKMKLKEQEDELASQRSAAETVVSSLTQRLGMLERQNAQSAASARLRPAPGSSPKLAPPARQRVCSWPLDRFGRPTCR